ncbi:serine/threonine-protein kinase [Paraliomyxa miuraensis]|uniref:serine/threonine-protein kinase n=1 Tax=Paraliomyxa miuraensis TaxID=376150 RepID=UPI00224F1512|nr:serine/threonine-protein kinase [Paraliomyxa miuraensis]MCX4240872.1 serine/threonine protein kinase [Paraliomyxa miuraensis]
MDAIAAPLDVAARITQPFAAAIEDAPKVDAKLVIHSKQYRIVGTLGEGGMGMVYRAYDPLLERDVALKVLKPGLPAAARRCFRAEALHGARLCHPNLARIFDLGILPDRGLEWFAMEYLRGKDLERLIMGARRRGLRFSLTLMFQVFDGILDALAYAHRQGVIHRDVKPSNIFVTREPHAGRVSAKLLDFGVACDVRRQRDDEIERCGDPRYVAPEQALGTVRPDARTDVYAAGISLFEVLTGRHPFEELLGQPAKVLIEAQVGRPIPAPSQWLPLELSAGVRCGLDVVVAKACAKDPKQRFESANDMRRALLDALPG